MIGSLIYRLASHLNPPPSPSLLKPSTERPRIRSPHSHLLSTAVATHFVQHLLYVDDSSTPSAPCFLLASATALCIVANRPAWPLLSNSLTLSPLDCPEGAWGILNAGLLSRPDDQNWGVL